MAGERHTENSFWPWTSMINRHILLSPQGATKHKEICN